MIAIVLFALLTAMLCWFLIGTKGKWWAKVPLILIVPFLGFLTHQIPDTYKGWPTTVNPPVTSRYITGIVREPDAASGDKGAIYLILVPGKGTTSDHGLGYESKNGEPRAYVQPYTRELHKQVDEANGITKKGGTVQARATRQHGRANSTQRVPRFLVRLYNLPPGLPPKAVG